MILQSHSWVYYIWKKKYDLKGYMHPIVFYGTVYNCQDVETT